VSVWDYAPAEREDDQPSQCYSITSLARASSVGGTSRPSTFACGLAYEEIELGRLLDGQVGRLRPT